MQNNDRERLHWENLVQQANSIRRELDKKPQQFRKRHTPCPRGILNAYREGDLSFDGAVKAIEAWGNP